MLSAEHVALQSRLVQQLVTVRQREMDTILARYSALGTQASLLAGFAITSLTALSPSEPTVSTPITHLFYGSSIVCLLACIHVIICTMYTSNWAPALALRGPSGSLARAYNATRGEKTQINAYFLLGIIAFAVQTIAAIWILDNVTKVTADAGACTGATVVAGLASLIYHVRMHRRFFGGGEKIDLSEQTVAAAGAARYAAAGGPDGRGSTNANTMPLLDNPVATVDTHPDIQVGASAQRRQEQQLRQSTRTSSRCAACCRSARSPSTRAGPRAGCAPPRAPSPRNGKPRHSPATSRRPARPRLSACNWRGQARPLFVLKDAHLQYWRSQADYEAGKAAAMDNPINLRGFEVAVDMSDPKWGFTLTPLEPGQRAWALRAPTEADRLGGRAASSSSR